LNTGTITAQTNNKKKRQKKNENKLKIWNDNTKCCNRKHNKGFILKPKRTEEVHMHKPLCVLTRRTALQTTTVSTTSGSRFDNTSCTYYSLRYQPYFHTHLRNHSLHRLSINNASISMCFVNMTQWWAHRKSWGTPIANWNHGDEYFLWSHTLLWYSTF
jgi:hypothetical protein